MSFQGLPADDRQQPATGSGSETQRQQPTTEPSLLDQVLEETLTAANGGAIDPRERIALIEVARRFRGQVFSLQPVAVALVESVLEARFDQVIPDPTARHQMACEVAGTLVATEDTCARLQVMWARLCEAAR